MNDEGQFGPPSFLAEVLAGLMTVLTGVAGFVGSQVWSNTKKLYALGESVTGLKEQMEQYRATELMYRVDMIRRLERLEGVYPPHGKSEEEDNS